MQHYSSGTCMLIMLMVQLVGCRLGCPWSSQAGQQQDLAYPFLEIATRGELYANPGAVLPSAAYMYMRVGWSHEQPGSACWAPASASDVGAMSI